jgi:prepilin-type N-terminal cleavage/methylation domain-containing protein
MRISVRSRPQGFTLIEIMIVVAIIGLLVAVAVPNLFKARAKSQTTACIKNLQMIDGAKETWAVETKRGVSDPVIDSEVNGYIKGGAPLCPGKGTYAYNGLTQAPTCTLPGHVLPNIRSASAAGGTAGTGGTSGSTTSGGTGTGSGSGGSGSGDNSGPGSGSR